MVDALEAKLSLSVAMEIPPVGNPIAITPDGQPIYIPVGAPDPGAPPVIAPTTPADPGLC